MYIYMYIYIYICIYIYVYNCIYVCVPLITQVPIWSYCYPMMGQSLIPKHHSPIQLQYMQFHNVLSTCAKFYTMSKPSYELQTRLLATSSTGCIYDFLSNPPTSATPLYLDHPLTSPGFVRIYGSKSKSLDGKPGFSIGNVKSPMPWTFNANWFRDRPMVKKILPKPISSGHLARASMFIR